MPGIFWLLISLLLLVGCDRTSVGPEYFRDMGLSQADSRTLASLKRINDHPFYTMRYYGEYDVWSEPEAAGPGAMIPITSIHGNLEPWACSCFAALSGGGDRLMGRNFDWYDHLALLLYTDPPDGYASVSMVDLYHFGYRDDRLPDIARNRLDLLDTPQLPIDGMNEMGLAIGLSAIPRATPPYVPGRTTVGDVGIIRIALDHAADVEEAIGLFGSYNIATHEPPLHYLLADSSGHSAVIEFVEGEMIVRRNSDPWQVSTNFILTGIFTHGGNDDETHCDPGWPGGPSWRSHGTGLRRRRQHWQRHWH